MTARILFGPLHDGDAVRYRQEVFQDLENPEVLRTFERFKQGAVKNHRIRYRTWPGINQLYYRLGGWLEETKPYP